MKWLLGGLFVVTLVGVALLVGWIALTYQEPGESGGPRL